MVLRIQCPNCGTAYRLADPLPPEGKRYRCKCSAVITVAYPDAVRERLAAKGAIPAPDTQALKTGPVPSGARPTGPDGLNAAGLQTTGSTRRPPSSPPYESGDATPPNFGPSQTATSGRSNGNGAGREPQDAAPTQRMEPNGSLSGFAGFTAPPSMPPMSQSLRERHTDASSGLTSPVAPPPLEDTLRDHQRVPPPATVAPPQSAPPRSVKAPGAGVPAPARRERVTTAPSATPPSPPLRRPLPTVGSAGGSAPNETPAKTPAAPTPATKPPAPATKPPGADKRDSKPRGRRPIWHWLAALLMFGVLVGACTFFGVIWHFSQGLPSVESLAVYEPPVGTIVTDEQGNFVGEFFKEQRYVVPFEEIPEDLRNAFVSAEDAAFWEHSGLDYMGIVRAMIKNVKAGRMAQGASTITQQVARSFLLTKEKKLSRKIREAILSYRVENSFDKEHILYLYLNQIFLGHGAYGVGAAAHLYFDKDVSELNLAECAIIAGLPQAPSNYSPNRNFKAAKARQRYVLDQMAKRGYVTQEEADAAYASEMVFSKKRDRNLDVAPFYVEHVRRYLFDKAKEAENLRETDPEAFARHPYANLNPLRSALTVTLPIDLDLQKAANQAIADGVRFADKRIGWRGAPKNLTDPSELAAEKTKIDKARTLALTPYHPAFELPKGEVPADVLPPLTEGEITRGIVKELGRTWALVDVGAHQALMHVEDFAWCHNVNPEVNFKYFKCRRLDDVLHVGDVVGVRVEKIAETWTKTLPRKHPLHSTPLARLSMEQDPWPEASTITMRTTDGGVLAMVGGTSYEGSEFNRAVQAMRQVGSTFKPLVYAAALDSEDDPFTLSSILVDAPIVEAMTGKEGELWKPGNSGGDYLGDTTFRRGLILSRNIVTLKICQQIGVEYALDYVKRFGFESPVDPNLASCLGASAITLKEMVSAYSTFATLGTRVEPRFITAVKDRHGNTVEAPLAVTHPETMSEETAYMMVNLLNGVVTAGTARKALELNKTVSGKTGTTNSYRDAWFVGFTPEVVTGVWVGLDEFKSMGRGQYGGEVALPIWVDIMAHALEDYPPSEFEKPEDIKLIKVDPLTGKLAREGQPGVKVPFLKGTEPEEEAPIQGAVDAADFLSGEY